MTSPAAANPNVPESSIRRFGWIAVSLIFHTLLVLVLLRTMGAPLARQTPLEAMTSTTASDRIEQVIEEVRQHEAEELAKKVEELHRAEEELAKLDQEKIADYKAVATELAQNAPSQIKESESEAVAAQQQAMEAQKAADAAQQKASAAEQAASSAPAESKAQESDKIRGLQKEAVAAQENALRAQKAASAAEAGVVQTFPFADASFKEAAAAQQMAVQAQVEAKAAQDSAKDAQQGPVNDAEKMTREREDKLQPAAQKFAEAEKKAAAAETRIAATGPALAAAESKAATEKQALAAAQAGDDKPAAAAAEKSSQAAATEVDGTRKANDEAKRQMESERNALASAKNDLEQKQKEEAAGRAEAAQKQLAANAAQGAADSAQAKALELQTKAEAVAAAATAQAGASDPSSNDAVKQAVAETHVLPLENVQKESLAKLYDTAAASEKNAAEIFRELRAAETAALRHIPLDEARRTTDVVQPLRNAVNKELLAKKISTPEEAREHAQAVRGVVQEIDSMVSLARDLVREAKGEQESAVTLDSIKAEAAQNAELEREAAQDYGQQAKDLSGLMRALDHGKGQEDASRGAMRAALAGLLPLATLNGDQELAAQILSALAAMAHEGEGSGKGVAGQPHGGSGPPTLKPVNGHTLPAIPGRKVLQDGVYSDWMFVDSWWILGPFPNPNRRNIEEKFPPESVIDLDASYIGKNNKKIRWQFVQSAHAEIWPPDDEEYQIYYAYTELWFEEASDRWIAVGSDDYSKVWIEGMLVWKSGDQLKGWNIDEGFRKVHFKKGLNRVLYRVENGWRSTQFSLCVAMKDEK